MCKSFQPHPQHLSNQSQLETNSYHSNRFIAENNKKALELLMRIQSQIEASTVIATSTKRECNYE